MTQTVIPQLRITDEAHALAFYRDGLGFSIDWQHRFAPGLPLFARISRAGQALFLSAHAGDCQPGGAVYPVVPDVDGCGREFAARGVTVDGPHDTPWGTRELRVVDPDGNRLRFATHPGD